MLPAYKNNQERHENIRFNVSWLSRQVSSALSLCGSIAAHALSLAFSRSLSLARAFTLCCVPLSFMCCMCLAADSRAGLVFHQECASVFSYNKISDHVSASTLLACPCNISLSLLTSLLPAHFSALALSSLPFLMRLRLPTLSLSQTFSLPLSLPQRQLPTSLARRRMKLMSELHHPVPIRNP